MDIGIGLPNPVRGAEGTTLVQWAGRAEAAGFSTLATIDRIAYPSYESLITLAAAAGATRRIGLLTNVLLGPTRNPVLLAKETASLDPLGIAPGGRRDDFDVTGLSFPDRGRRLDEQLDLLQRAWKGEPVAGSPQPISPLPIADAIPIMIGGMCDRTIERTVKFGVGWTAGGAPPQVVAPFLERVHAAWKDSRREETPRIVCLSYFSVGQEERSAAYLEDYYAYTGDYVAQIVAGAPRAPEAIRERVARFRDLGIDELILDPTVAELDQVDRLAEIVL
jgi:alkanesulfonate monooxygenase SsuD/methylene tetrahydromethanopterin reductase-like flavin-dependent oxidoreductase (luciferase family)